uniref:Tetrapyrrole biosynthesis uroporphyrinogen III synthase domain-containing protein n=1 Tax=Compsopogon caeruleus TaxID=31354 RepID=A0A7S1TDA4_9RHOD|mmetsp:Transcript_18505/g.38769  ORF Transcript_18505/g.38769 Transcript_18505/m.38769 type:complete len:343 (+) Transcript_18505:276-1304(+)
MGDALIKNRWKTERMTTSSSSSSSSSCVSAFGVTVVASGGGWLADQAMLPRRLMLLCPREQASRLAPRLVERDMRPIWCPLVTTAPLDAERELEVLDEGLLRLSDYRYMIFPARVAIESVGLRLRKMLDLEDTTLIGTMLRASGTKFCTLARDAIAMKPSLGVLPDLVSPRDSSLDGLAEQIVYDAGTTGMSNVTVLFPTFATKASNRRGLDFIQILEDNGATVTVAPAYSMQATDPIALEWEFGLLRSGGIDFVVFTSPTDVETFCLLFPNAKYSISCWIACLGVETGKAAREIFNREPEVVTEGFDSIQKIVNDLEEFFLEATSARKGGLIIPSKPKFSL